MVRLTACASGVRSDGRYHWPGLSRAASFASIFCPQTPHERRPWYSIPATQENHPRLRDSTRIYPIQIAERVYDLGWRENWLSRYLIKELQGRPKVNCTGSLAPLAFAESPKRVQVAENEHIDALACVGFLPLDHSMLR